MVKRTRLAPRFDNRPPGLVNATHILPNIPRPSGDETPRCDYGLSAGNAQAVSLTFSEFLPVGGYAPKSKSAT